MKRLLSKALIALMIASAAAMLAFGPRSRFVAPAGRVRIQYWEKWTGLEGEQMKEIVDEFNDTVGKDKGIWVDFVSMSQIDRKTLISTAAGVPPDVAGLWDTQVLQFASMNALEPLDGFARQFGLTRDRYKHVYYDGCEYHGRLYAIPSTVWCIALLWNREVFHEKAAELCSGPGSRTGSQNDCGVGQICRRHRHLGNARRQQTSDPHGVHPAGAGDSHQRHGLLVRGHDRGPDRAKVLINSPQMFATYNWIRSYSERLGRDSLAEFRSGFSSGATSLFDTPQNPFLVGWDAMEQQGPWMSAFIEKLKPSFNRYHVPPDQLQREKDFDRIDVGMTLDQVQQVLGQGDSPSHGLSQPPAASGDGQMLHWLAGVKDIYITFVGDKVMAKEANWIPAEMRQKYCQWGAPPFPSAMPGRDDVTWAGFDVWVIPSTSKHKKEAMEFIAFASSQKEIEKISSEHCNLSPLLVESKEYLENHPNPYVDVYEKLAASPNARPLPRLINWPQISDELTQIAERSYMLKGSTADILNEEQVRCQKELNKALDVPENTNLDVLKTNEAHEK